MEKELITSYRFKKYLTSQPYFVWHSLKDEGLSFNEDTFDIDFWSDQEPAEVTENVGAVVARTFELINVHLREKLKKEKEIFITTGDVDNKIQQTKDMLDSGKIIIDPVFVYNGAISKPYAFDTEEKIIINLKYSKKTRRSDIVTGFFDYSVISKNTEVRDYNIYLPESKEYKAGEISLIGVETVHPTMTGDIPFACNSKGVQKDERIMGIFKTRVVVSKKKGLDIMLPDFDDALKGIEAARLFDKVDKNKLSMDVRDFGANSEWNELLEYIDSPYAGINGKVVTKKQIVNNEVNEDENLVLSTLNKLTETQIFNKNIKEYNAIKEATKVVWYDFEGYSLPISPLDGVNPYQQLVFQVSVIVTVNNKETFRENHVIDPQKINLNRLYEIIEKVHQGGANGYVVYNRGYEIPRMTEICNLLFHADHPKYQRAVEMLDLIETNTIDLMNVFQINTKKRLPPIMLNDQHAKASIKNVEKHITGNKIELPRPITPYKNLDVQNGGMAMNEAIHRALGITGDKEWETKEKQLKLYCENDVKAMIMVYDFIAKLKGEI